MCMHRGRHTVIYIADKIKTLAKFIFSKMLTIVLKFKYSIALPEMTAIIKIHTWAAVAINHRNFIINASCWNVFFSNTEFWPSNESSTGEGDSVVVILVNLDKYWALGKTIDTATSCFTPDDVCALAFNKQRLRSTVVRTSFIETNHLLFHRKELSSPEFIFRHMSQRTEFCFSYLPDNLEFIELYSNLFYHIQMISSFEAIEISYKF